jgi:hypothetical protein
VELQFKKDRWLLRKGVEAADDEQEILRHLRQIAVAFDEFQVRAYSSRALVKVTDDFQTKVLLRIERNTDSLIQVGAFIQSTNRLSPWHTIGLRFPEYATLSQGSLQYGSWLGPASMH